LFIEAINTNGASAVLKLDQYCQETKKGYYYPACQHGIGHGLVEYFGHKNIGKVLRYCSLIQKNLLVGCSSGVFMEYFFPSAIFVNKNAYVSIKENDPFKPCTTIPSEFKPSCIYELPRLWKYTQKDYTILTKRCLSLKNLQLQKFCFRGLGYATGDTTNPHPQFSLQVCSDMPDQNTKLYCLSGATWFYKTVNRSEIAIHAINTLCSYSIDEPLCKRLSDLNLEHL
jgi:hypothetical protein